MSKIQGCILLFGLLGTLLFPQEKSARLKHDYESFNYKAVIRLADSLTLNAAVLTADELKDVYRFKGLSHFSLGDERNAEQSFTELLKLDNGFELDPVKTSPKILAFFREVKQRSRIAQTVKEPVSKEPVIIRDTVFIQVPPITVVRKDTVYVKSEKTIPQLLIPGYFQLSQNKTVKGWGLICAAAVSAAASVYFSVDAAAKEKDYLNAIDRAAIVTKYDSYNTSYKLRNASLMILAAAIVYSHVDMYLFSDESARLSAGASISPQFSSVLVTFRLDF